MKTKQMEHNKINEAGYNEAPKFGPSENNPPNDLKGPEFNANNNNMKLTIKTKEFIPYEQTLELKELGFDEPCFGCYDEKTIFGLTVMSIKQYYTNSKEDTWNCAAPLYQQAFRWFREKYKLHSTITSISQESWQWHITRPGESLGKLYDEDFYTYEEAELACLKKLIKIVKNK